MKDGDLTFDDVVKVLDRTMNGGARWSGDDQVTGLCPAHDDRSPSLSVKRGKSDKVLLYCHAGCSFDAVKAAILRLLDPTTPLSKRQQQELKARVRQEEPFIVATTIEYEIKDEKGVLQAIHVRLQDKDRNKRMFWKLPHGTLGLGGRKVEDLPLYGSENLKDIPLDTPIYVCEGEKDCVALWKRGLPAVATVTGAQTIPNDNALSVLVGRHVRLWPDNDAIGRRHMTRIADRLEYLNGLNDQNDH